MVMNQFQTVKPVFDIDPCSKVSAMQVSLDNFASGRKFVEEHCPDIVEGVQRLVRLVNKLKTEA